MSEGLTHLNAAGAAHMVDVTGREVTVRIADTSARVNLSSHVVSLLRDGKTPKGDVLATRGSPGLWRQRRPANSFLYVIQSL